MPLANLNGEHSSAIIGTPARPHVYKGQVIDCRERARTRDNGADAITVVPL
jgi:hypothetical protein